MVVPEDQEIANERPTAAELVDAVGSDSTIFASEQADVDEVVEIERIEIVEVVEPGHNDFLKKRRSIIIASMAVGCFILFALSVLISSRVSCICSKPDRVSDFQNRGNFYENIRVIPGKPESEKLSIIPLIFPKLHLVWPTP